MKWLLCGRGVANLLQDGTIDDPAVAGGGSGAGGFVGLGVGDVHAVDAPFERERRTFAVVQRHR